ncbi:Uncharacterised protein [uncultured archaeon]|nr:Uncharacterised protein [uncultured archaeon]
MKANSIESLSGEHFVLKDATKAAEVFERHIDFGRLKDADQLIADAVRSAEGKVYFKLADEVTMYAVSGSEVTERTLRPHPLGSKTEGFGAVTERLSDETSGTVRSDLQRSKLLEKFNAGFAALKSSYGAGSSYFIESELAKISDPIEKAEKMKNRNVSVFFERLEHTLKEQIAKGQRTELPNISKFTVDRHVAELGKMQDHQMADKYIDTAVGIYARRKLVER